MSLLTGGLQGTIFSGGSFYGVGAAPVLGKPPTPVPNRVGLPTTVLNPLDHPAQGLPKPVDVLEGLTGTSRTNIVGRVRQLSTEQRTNVALSELNNLPGNFDAVSRSELANMFSNHTASIDTLLSTLAQARAGTGMFGVRKLNEAQKSYLSMHPGRSQLSPNSGF